MEQLSGHTKGRYYIWTESNPCGSCSREMYRAGCKEEGKVPYHAKGLCSACYQSGKANMIIHPEPPIGSKICNKCNQCLDSILDFSINLSTTSGRSPWCKKCTTLNKFKMNRNDYDLMVLDQGGLCLICSEDPTLIGKVLVVDHDRACCPGNSSCGDCIRGLLCPTCNSGLGFFRDSRVKLQNAINYLKERECPN